MKIISWNVNWIRAVAKKGFKEFINSEKPDIFCLQETKAFASQFEKDLWEIEWYNYIWHTWTRAWYAWTAIFYKKDLEIIDLKNDFESSHFTEDWRVTEIEFFYNWEHTVLLNWYFPNWWTRADWTEMLTYKLEFYNELIKYVNKLVSENKKVIITWDFNICHTEIDIARSKENENSIWFLPIERAKVSELLSNGYTDTFRYFYPWKTDIYSWWSYRAWARPRNVWWRIDYFVVNNDFIDSVEDIIYMTDIMWSDHCPVKLILK